MEKKYYLTERDIDNLLYLKNMFKINSVEISKLCSQDKPNIELGFCLGKISHELYLSYQKMMELEDSIKSQKIINN